METELERCQVHLESCCWSTVAQILDCSNHKRDHYMQRVKIEIEKSLMMAVVDVTLWEGAESS